MYRDFRKISPDGQKAINPRPVFLDVKAAQNSATAERQVANNFAQDAFGRNVAEAKSDIVYKSMRPVIFMLRLLGGLPIQHPKPGLSRFRKISIQMIYSIIIFGLVCANIGYVFMSGIKIKSSSEGSFEETVIAYLFIVYLIPICMVPIMWYESGKISTSYNDWSDFEDLYKRTTGRNLPINVTSKALWSSLMLPIISTASAIINHVTMVHFTVLHVIPYCYLAVFIYVLGGSWYLICEIIAISANALADDFQKALKHVGPANIVADYRALWLRLSKLTRDTGISMCYLLIFLSLYLFLVITLSIYGLLSQISTGFGTKDIGLVLTAFYSIILLFFVCDEAHFASTSVRVNFQKKLLTVELSWMNSDAQIEINMFLKSTDLNPTDISLDGFYSVNRSLFKSLLATMVTYLVVLLQFQISIPAEGKPVSNTTEATNIK